MQINTGAERVYFYLISQHISYGMHLSPLFNSSVLYKVVPQIIAKHNLANQSINQSICPIILI